MATYAVGDIQGCLTPLLRLLDDVNFSPKSDTLWVAGDLVNRGPESLEALRFVKNLPNAVLVLGNHDLHLLAAANGARAFNRKDTLNGILEAKDRDHLLSWLRHCPLLHHDKSFDVTMVHAGIPPNWSIKQARKRAKEVEDILQSDEGEAFFQNMYGNMPNRWDKSLKGFDRARLITNYFTRMRFCSVDGTLELETKTGPDSAPKGFAPWFAYPDHKCRKDTILFGHWASLGGISGFKNKIALDTGCVWGGTLSMIRLDDRKMFCTDCEL